MQATSAADAGPPRASRRYHVLFWPHVVSTPTSDLSGTGDGNRDEPVELSARLKLKLGQVYLHLTHRPREANLPEHPASAPATQDGGARAKHSSFAPSQRSSKQSRWLLLSLPPSRSSLHRHHSPVTSVDKKHEHAGAPSTSSASCAHPHLKQHYTIALTEISPLAAQLPLSAELRSSLHLNRVDRDAATYSSHSTPRAPFMSLASWDLSGAPSALSSNFCCPPGCDLSVTSARPRDSNLSARRASSRRAKSTTATYGQYLDVAEPLRSSTRTLPSPLLTASSKGTGCWQSSSCPGEGDATRGHHSPCTCTSHAPRGKGSRLLTPLVDKAPASQTLPITHLSSSSFGSLTPPQTHAASLRLFTASVILEYEELLGVTFFGVPETAGVANCSSSDDEGHGLLDKASRRFGHRQLHGTLLSSIVPPKQNARRPQSARAPSPHSEVISDDDRGAVTPLHPPHGHLPTPWKCNHATRSPVFAPTAHVCPRKVPELPFKLNQAQTCCLRFLTETDMREFLSCYIEMQTYVKQMQEKSAAAKRWAEAGGRDSGGRQLATSRLTECDKENSVSSEYEVYLRDSTTNSPGSPSTTTYNEHSRHSKALGPRGSSLSTNIVLDDLLRDSQPAASEGIDGGQHDNSKRYTEFSALSTPVQTTVRSHGWQDYLRRKVDPRYGISYATVPLFLWHSFLRLAPSVLYTCQRGFLIVERLPTPSSPDRSEYGSRNSRCAELKASKEASKQRLNDLVCRPLSPIGAALEVAPSTMQPRQRQASPSPEGVSERCPTPLVPVAALKSLPSASTTRSSCDDVKLVLPSVASAPCERTDEHITTFKDVFLCLSESHLLFMNSFGHAWFHFSFDEIVLITHSAAMDSFPTHPFLRFRLKPSECFDTPTFVLMFILLPDVPHHVQLASASASLRPPEAEPVAQRGSARSTSSPSVSAQRATAWASGQAPGESVAVAGHCVSLVEAEEKERLLCRHKALLDIFETVCPRPVERCTFTELMCGENSKAHRARLRQLLLRASTGVPGFPLADNSSDVYAGASSWMAQQHSTTPILCVKLTAGDISVADSDARRSEGAHPPANQPPLASSRSSSARQARDSRRRLSPPHRAPDGSRTSAFAGPTLRWGRDDPGIVLKDAGHDMDFSFERATRTMPLLACKETVSQGYSASSQAFQPHGLYPTRCGSGSAKAKKKNEDGGAKGSSLGGAEDMYIPMAPKKRRSSIVRCVSMKEL
ncbi:hypothetical protein, unknown function [Leishmania infantum JPCM5]|uniref:Uncharacterized protein n=2 Tax=Leishmania infantum TaxID=5671 RepID=A4I746_LEIIN|nr:hypothetical protein, unknown function [Leishmania infantum JPCM5]CAC9520796.1 hypothetical_protein_-_conserved [Leishmania infantum]CAM70625.1 hypothetical protein, unknown function [Leishmania infantum JPCM5]SUZ44475.1 hypothetical_protein_-_conserved [Leishmania infantum]|eukprot:XP_001467565.1 hypothetical protein, unknown function [Leishmania infantum JPCM5]